MHSFRIKKIESIKNKKNTFIGTVMNSNEIKYFLNNNIRERKTTFNI